MERRRWCLSTLERPCPLFSLSSQPVFSLSLTAVDREFDALAAGVAGVERAVEHVRPRPPLLKFTKPLLLSRLNQLIPIKPN